MYHQKYTQALQKLSTINRRTLGVMAAAAISPLALASSHYITASLYNQHATQLFADTILSNTAEESNSIDASKLGEETSLTVASNPVLRVVFADTSNIEVVVTKNPETPKLVNDSLTVTEPNSVAIVPTVNGTIAARIDTSTATTTKKTTPTTTTTTKTTPTTTTTKKTTPTTNTNISRSGSRNNALAGYNFYREEWGAAVVQYNDWKHSRVADANLIKKIADQPIGAWIGGWTDENYIRSKQNIAAQRGQAPIWIVYHLPHLNCGGGGHSSGQAYKNWIDAMSRGIGNGKSVVVVEPDALPMINCLNGTQQNERYNLIKYAVERFKNHNPNAVVYIDAGHSTWVDSTTMANRLKRAGIDQAQGFSLNVSNFAHTAPNTAYGNELSRKTNNAHFVIDTSRNGNGAAPGNEWCNPRGRALGQKPTVDYGNALQDGLLWLKYPGESDEPCNGGPNAGVWWPEYALELARNAHW